MKKSIGILAVAAAAVTALVLAGTAFAQDGGVEVSDGSATPGSEGDVILSATGVGDPGLGAWTIDISYDTDVITAVDCAPEQGGVCNEEFAEDTVRITGASASGLEGDTDLGAITFECGDAEGESDLTIAISVFADATIGDPQDLEPSISNGTFTCGEETAGPTAAEPTDLPDTGTSVGAGGGSSSLSWFIVLAAVIGVLGLAGTYGVVRLRQ